ncbi:MAG: WYL domain-containing transcriptional regulator [Ignavibacteriae bacterium]|nr:MAG: WYL domain-containing transcriptional regulator [Ignavibacteriota bacterium]
MLDIKSKLKRQIEILGITLSQNFPSPLNTFDLADMFKVEELTIKRDLQDLRASGIDMHSVRRKGICLTNNLPEQKIRELIQQYSALSYSDGFVEKSTMLFVKRLREKALANMVTLQMCIDTNREAMIDYEKESEELEFGRAICPVLIFELDNYWRVLAVNEGKLKQFHLNKIIEVRISNKNFKPIAKENIEEVFKYSWRSWLGPDKYNIKLRFSPQWAERLRPKQLMDTETLTECADGSIVYETTVNSLEEIAGWIVTRGRGVVVLEPEVLREKVIKLAKEVLDNYD